MTTSLPTQLLRANDRRPGPATWFRMPGLVLCLLLLLVLSGCGSTAMSAGTGKLDEVKFALDWIPNANDTGIYVALAKGWYKQQGIQLTILPYSNTISPEQLVASGQAQFGVSYSESLVQNRALHLPLVSVAAIYQHNTSGLVSLKSSGLDSLAKLAGKTFAGYGAPFEKPLVKQVLSCQGASSGGFKYVTTDLDTLAALQSGKFDFSIMSLGWGVIQARYAGVGLNFFSFTQNCIPDSYETLMNANQPFLQAHPDIAKRFMAATAQGYTYAAQHPVEAANILVAEAPKGTFPDLKEILGSQQYNSAQYINDGKCWGEQTLQKWTDYPQFMYTHQAILDAAGKPVTSAPDYAAEFTDAFLPTCK